MTCLPRGVWILLSTCLTFEPLFSFLQDMYYCFVDISRVLWEGDSGWQISAFSELSFIYYSCMVYLCKHLVVWIFHKHSTYILLSEVMNQILRWCLVFQLSCKVIIIFLMRNVKYVNKDLSWEVKQFVRDYF